MKSTTTRVSAESASTAAAIASASHPLAESSSGQPAAVPVMSVGAVKQEIPATTVTTNLDHNPSASAAAFLVSKALTARTSASTAMISSVYSALSNGKTVPLEGGTNTGIRCEKAGVLGGTQSAGEGMKAGLFGGEAASGILASTGTSSIEVAGRAAALADGVIRSGKLMVRLANDVYSRIKNSHVR